MLCLMQTNLNELYVSCKSVPEQIWKYARRADTARFSCPINTVRSASSYCRQRICTKDIRPFRERLESDRTLPFHARWQVEPVSHASRNLGTRALVALKPTLTQLSSMLTQTVSWIPTVGQHTQAVLSLFSISTGTSNWSLRKIPSPRSHGSTQMYPPIRASPLPSSNMAKSLISD